ncbi:NUDIX domain-containing protein [Candidatus Woesearchaeota archaeon]|nr:NUDIX domain-containing protein [Candidatus Woesearchaeota archaeon]
MKVERSAGAIIFRIEKGIRKYLLLHYSVGHWEYVKGHIEKGEATETTIRRETVEETGIKDLKFITDFKETVQWYFKHEDKLIKKYVVFYLAETKIKEIKLLSHEHIGYAWLPYEKALEKVTFKSTKDILKKAEKFLSKK